MILNFRVTGLIFFIVNEFFSSLDCLPTAQEGKFWALLVAGSKGYWNYRHQADICHSYQTLRRYGIPEQNIIVMMYDDIAYHHRNPSPGLIINAPDGSDVYEGVKKDYTGRNVTVKNFLNILKGDKSKMAHIGTGRVIESGPNDYLFVNFVDHGSHGMLGFPFGVLYAADLYTVLRNMSLENKFNTMVLYIEACDAGSMFDGILEDNLNIFAMTAANNRESSYACYYDELRDAYLGDSFSVNWMDLLDSSESANLSLHRIFHTVRHNTTTSNVQEYGDLNIGGMTFFKNNNEKQHGFQQYKKKQASIFNPNKDAVRSMEVPIEILKRKLKTQTNTKIAVEIQEKINFIIKKRLYVDDVVESIVKMATNENGLKIQELLTSNYGITRNNMECSKIVSQAFDNNCFKIAGNPYVGSKLFIFTNMCSIDYLNEQSIINAIARICSQLSSSSINEEIL